MSKKIEKFIEEMGITENKEGTLENELEASMEVDI